MYNKCEYSKSNNNVLISPKHYNFSKKDNLPNSKNKKEMDFYSNFTRTSKSPLNLNSKHKITYLNINFHIPQDYHALTAHHLY